MTVRDAGPYGGGVERRTAIGRPYGGGGIKTILTAAPHPRFDHGFYTVLVSSRFSA